MRYALFTFVGLSLLVVGNAEGQRNCRKGLPCGNTCIAANKVCHVGTPATPPSTPLASAVAPKPADSTTVAPTDNNAWVASSRGHTYYRRGCSRANHLLPANLIYFRTEEEARRAGYSRSTTRGC